MKIRNSRLVVAASFAVVGLSVLPSHGIEAESTPVERLTVKEGSKVERLYSVPKEALGSWVTLCKNDKGRLIGGD